MLWFRIKPLHSLSSSLSPRLSPCLSFGDLSKGCSRSNDGNQRFRGQNQRPSSWGSSPKLLAQVGRASTNTGHFPVCGSRCWQRQPPPPGLLEENMLPLLWYWLRSRANKVSMLCKFRSATSPFFFHVKWKFRWNWRELLLTKAALIVSFNLVIIHWSLSKTMTYEQNHMFRIKSCATVQAAKSKPTTCTTELREGRLLRFK